MSSVNEREPSAAATPSSLHLAPVWQGLRGLKTAIAPLALAAVTGFLLDRLSVPVGWLLGPMLAGIGWSIARRQPQPLPHSLMVVGQAIIAIATATRFSLETAIAAKTYALPLLLCILITGGMSLLNGYLLWRWTDIDRATGFLGCIPGAGPSLVAMSEEMGADAIAVAALQYLRILLVSSLIPLLVSFLFAGEVAAPDAIAPLTNNFPETFSWSSVLIVALCSGVGLWLGKQLRLPSPLFLGPLFVGLAVEWILPGRLQVPQSLFLIGLLLLGLSIGIKFDWEAARKLVKALVIELGLVLVLIALCFGVGYEFHQIAQVDTLTAVLGSTPGGINAMMATVLELGGDAGLVLAMQMTRMLSILLISPWFAAYLLRSQSDTAA